MQLSTISKAHLAMFFVALIYGANYTVAKIVLDDHYIGPKGFIVFRVLAAIILISITHYIWVKEKVEKSDILLLMLCGLFGVAINQMFFFMGLKETVPIHAALIMTMTPLIVLTISVLVGREQWSVHKIIGLVLGLSGAVYLITEGSTPELSDGTMRGDIMILINALSYGIYLVIAKKLLDKYHPVTIMKWVFGFGLCYVLPFGYREAIDVNWQSFDRSIWLAFGFVLVFTTYLAYVLNAFALSKVSPSIVSIYIYLQPLLASIIAIWLQKDQLDAVKITSGLLIISGVWLASKKKKM